eukprot:15580-Heterococcus_DN1.PRE.2
MPLMIALLIAAEVAVSRKEISKAVLCHGSLTGSFSHNWHYCEEFAAVYRHALCIQMVVYGGQLDASVVHILPLLFALASCDLHVATDCYTTAYTEAV